jgi:hypothetical protein
MIRNLYPAMMSAAALAVIGVPAVAQTTTPIALAADLSGRGANGEFSGTLTGDELCYRLTTSGLPGAENPRIVSKGGARVVDLLPIMNNTSEGCVDVGQQNARLIERNPSNFNVIVNAGSGSNRLEGQLRRV